MRDSPTVVPGPVGTDETIEGLMLAYALNASMSGGFVFAALDVEAAKEKVGRPRRQ